MDWVTLLAWVVLVGVAFGRLGVAAVVVNGVLRRLLPSWASARIRGVSLLSVDGVAVRTGASSPMFYCESIRLCRGRTAPVRILCRRVIVREWRVDTASSRVGTPVTTGLVPQSVKPLMVRSSSVTCHSLLTDVSRSPTSRDVCGSSLRISRSMSKTLPSGSVAAQYRSCCWSNML